MSENVDHKRPANSDGNGYGSILKGTSLLGGVQAFRLLINLLRGKFVAMLLGPDGMGMATMFTSASSTISSFSSLGLNLSFVKEVASAKEDPGMLAHIRTVTTTLVRFTAMLGALACACLAPWLSSISFGSTDYAWQFVLLSIVIALNVAGDGKMSMLQGMHRVKLLSYTSLLGSTMGLVAGVPLYYFFGTRGIVPAMIILSLTSYIVYSYGVRKLGLPAGNRFSLREHGKTARRMIMMGLVLLSALIINTSFTYLINIFIRIYGDLSHVGLFSAANSITLQYTGIVFSAMALDYFPRLSAAAHDRAKMEMIINRQMEIVALMAAPLAILLIATAPIVIRVLLTSEFLGVTELMRWLGLSILLKAIAYPLGYITFAKDNKRLFFWLEAVVCNLLYVGLSLLFYRGFGLIGLGYAAVTEQATCVLLYLSVNYKVYGFKPNSQAWKETAWAVLLGTAGFTVSLLLNGWLSYTFMALVFAVSACRSFKTLRARIRRK